MVSLSFQDCAFSLTASAPERQRGLRMAGEECVHTHPLQSFQVPAGVIRRLKLRHFVRDTLRGFRGTGVTTSMQRRVAAYKGHADPMC